MKILLIATNQADRFMDRMVVRPIPIGMAYLAAGVDESVHELRVLDLMFSDDCYLETEGVVREYQPDVIGLSIRNLDNQSIFNPESNLPMVKQLVTIIRKSSSAKIILGGPAFSILPSECLNYVGADIGVRGDADANFSQLLEKIGDGENYLDLPGLVYWTNGKVEMNESGNPSYYEMLPRLDLLDMRKYSGSGFGIGVVTKLADAYYPQISMSGTTHASQWRVRDTKDIIRDIKRLQADFKIRNMFFIDTAFNKPIEVAKEICTAVVTESIDIRWNSYLRPGDFDQELANLMKDSGCSLALLSDAGGESQNLEEKLISMERIVDLCRLESLPCAVTMDFGGPDETVHGTELKLSFLKKAAPTFTVLRLGKRVLPGTKIADEAMKSGLIDSEHDLLEPTFYVNPKLAIWLRERLVAETSIRPRWNLT